jgi:integrase
MARPKAPANRIVGIEDRGGAGPGRFRLRFVDDGRREARGFATRAGAEAAQLELERLWQKRSGVTVAAAIEAWLADRTAQGLAVQAYHQRWVPQLLADLEHVPVASLTSVDLEERYRDLAATKAGATSHLIHACLSVFCAFLHGAKHTRTNLIEGVARWGTAKAGKPQIETRRELHAFRDELWQRAWGGDRVCLAILVALYCGLRPGETQALCGRHVDVDRTLVVPGTKTTNAWRVLQVEVDDLWELLERTAAEVGPKEYLCRYTNRTVIDRIREVARKAGVANADELVFQSLRGQAASIARANGASLRAIADTLGHASTRVARKSYITDKAEAAGDLRMRMQVLDGGKR